MRNIAIYLLMILHTFNGALCACGNPPSVARSQLVSTPPYKVGDTADYQCDADYALSNNTLLCANVNGNDDWTGTTPTCECAAVSCQTTTTTTTATDAMTTVAMTTTPALTTATSTEDPTTSASTATPTTTEPTTTTTSASTAAGAVAEAVEGLPDWAIALLATLGALALLSLLGLLTLCCCLCCKRCWLYRKRYTWHQYPESTEYYYDTERGLYVDYHSGATYYTIPKRGRYLGPFSHNVIKPPKSNHVHIPEVNGKRTITTHMPSQVNSGHHKSPVKVHKNNCPECHANSQTSRQIKKIQSAPFLHNGSPVVHGVSDCPECVSQNTHFTGLGRNENLHFAPLHVNHKSHHPVNVSKESPSFQERPNYVVVGKVTSGGSLRSHKRPYDSHSNAEQINEKQQDPVVPAKNRERKRSMSVPHIFNLHQVRPNGHTQGPQPKNNNFLVTQVGPSQSPPRSTFKREVEKVIVWNHAEKLNYHHPGGADPHGYKHPPNIRYKFQTAIERVMGKGYKKPPVDCDCKRCRLDSA